MQLHDWIRNLVFAFDLVDSRRQDIRILANRVKLLEEFAREIRDNWDCDSDSHRYNTICRVCEAKKLLEEVQQPLSEI